jgi:hypothetical protein
MTEPLAILLDVIPVLAMVLAIVCIPLLGDGSRPGGRIVCPDKRRAAIPLAGSDRSCPDQREAQRQHPHGNGNH